MLPSDALVAVTGGSGFIGRHLLDRLLGEGFQVRALWRSSRVVERAGLELCHGSLESPDALARLVQGCDALVHVAAVTRGRRAEHFDAVNVAGTRRVAAALAEFAPGARPIAVSSLAAREPGLSWYSASKAAAEQVLLGMPQPWTILRPPAVYGPGDPALAPLWRALARGWLPRVGRPEARFSMLYVADLCEAIVRLLRHRTAVPGLLALHDGRARGYSWQSVARIAAAGRGAPVRTLPLPHFLLGGIARLNLGTAALRGVEPMLTPGKLRELVHADWTCDNVRIAAELDWSPATTLDAGLPHLPGWEKRNSWP